MEPEPRTPVASDSRTLPRASLRAGTIPAITPVTTASTTVNASDYGLATDTAGNTSIDTIVAPHPSATQGADARLISVSVCWTDASGAVQQVMMQRLALGDR